MLWDYRDDPYLAEYMEFGEKTCIRKTNSVYTDDRQVALRCLAETADQLRRAGDTANADRLVSIIIDRYQREQDEGVRSCIIRLCAPVCGRNSQVMQAFLCRLIAEGEPEAALSLAAAKPGNGLALLIPLTRHPKMEVRYEGAMALTVLGDQGGTEAVYIVVNQMKPHAWPSRIRQQSLIHARDTLRARADRMYAGSIPGISAPSPVAPSDEFFAIPKPDELAP